jgi:hypothetical protein
MTQHAIIRAEYRDLDWVVQVNYGIGGWESMAAFNVRGIAIKYAEDGKKTNKRLSYRVIELSKLQPTHAIIFETEKLAEKSA